MIACPRPTQYGLSCERAPHSSSSSSSNGSELFGSVSKNDRTIFSELNRPNDVGLVVHKFRRALERSKRAETPRMLFYIRVGTARSTAVFNGLIHIKEKTKKMQANLRRRRQVHEVPWSVYGTSADDAKFQSGFGLWQEDV